MKDVVLEVNDLVRYFTAQSSSWGSLVKSKAIIKAVDGLKFYIKKGQIFSLVGESGCGKTTIARVIMGLLFPTSGQIMFMDTNLFDGDQSVARPLRGKMQMVFQNPYASLNPRVTVEKIVGLPLRGQGLMKGSERRDRVVELLERVGLVPPESFLLRFPHELSGGQRQRVGIARALAPNPTFIIADEPVAALDMSIKSQILNLLMGLKEAYSLTYLLISHDLATVRYMSDWIAVIYLGKIVEYGISEKIFQYPQHPYTRALLNAVPDPNPLHRRKRVHLEGETPSPLNPPSGCRFHTRCPHVDQICKEMMPTLNRVNEGGHYVACHIRPSAELSENGAPRKVIHGNQPI